MEALEKTLRSVLQPLTHNLPPPIRNTATQLLGESCYRSLVHNVNLTDAVCLKLALSKTLGVVIVGASAVVKIPQLMKLLNSHSAEGISFLAYLLETSSYLISLAYNVRNQFPFSTYGEVALVAIQNVAISVLVLQYSGKAPVAALFVAGLAGAGYAMYNESIVPMPTLQWLQAGAGLLSVASKLPQIITIFQEGGTGQLSAFAVSTPLRNRLEAQAANLQMLFRCLTILLALLLASSRPCRKWTISSSCGALLQHLPSMPFSLLRWCTIGILQRAKRLLKRSWSHEANKPLLRRLAFKQEAKTVPRLAVVDE
jgi:mannose-P-dolichol utilization defect protein 1